ncbi:hypothetical protein KU6B_05260 [Mameliella alba]|uniref:hypothetical protein n=1 Tax=Mameliella alba TaxID=561184 RepID=UPI0013E4C3CD|nr:hypothetical protein [Mameliella alba]BBU54261.1 hypothetical protein KU6B_05260 [Mameliella alba]
MGEGGSDELYRGEDNDTYIWNPGDGADLIDETGGTDAIRFGPGIAPGDLSFNLDGYSLNVHVGGETLTLNCACSKRPATRPSCSWTAMAMAP